MENSVHIPIRETLASAMKQERRWKSHPKSSISSSSFSSQSGKAPLIMGFLSCLAWLYIAGRLWQDAENRMVLSSLLQKNSANIPKIFTVEDKLRNLGCNEIGRKIVEAEMDLTLAKSEGYLWGNGSASGKKLLAVIGVYTGFGSRLKRNVFRGSWMPRGDALRKLEERGVVIRFVIGRSANRGDSLDRNIDDENRRTKDFLILSANRGDSLDRNIDDENRRTKDFLILESHEEAAEELPKKAKFFFSAAVETWDAEFYIKVDDNINIDLNGLVEILESRRGRQGLYMGCMKSGNVISEEGKQWYEPEWWKFGDAKSYFRHASGSLLIISNNLARYININSASLQTYAHDDISVGSWMMGVDSTYVDNDRLCCSSSRQEKVCSMA